MTNNQNRTLHGVIIQLNKVNHNIRGTSIYHVSLIQYIHILNLFRIFICSMELWNFLWGEMVEFLSKLIDNVVFYLRWGEKLVLFLRGESNFNSPTDKIFRAICYISIVIIRHFRFRYRILFSRDYHNFWQYERWTYTCVHLNRIKYIIKYQCQRT